MSDVVKVALLATAGVVAVAGAVIFLGSDEPPRKRSSSSAPKEEKEEDLRVSGLANLGNTCYANSMLQVLDVRKLQMWCLTSYWKCQALSSSPSFVEALKSPQAQQTRILSSLCECVQGSLLWSYALSALV